MNMLGAIKSGNQTFRTTSEPDKNPAVNTFGSNIDAQETDNIGAISNVFDQAVSEYPIIKKHNIMGKVNIGAREGGQFLEFWPPGESGPPEYPRPIEFGDSPGVEIYNNETTPLDVLGDVTSHWLVSEDPVVSKYYDDFKSSLSPDQRSRLRGQYNYAQENFNEKRPYEDWESVSGMPSYFRGYAFKQWPEEFSEKAYTPDQMQMFDSMMEYLAIGE